MATRCNIIVKDGKTKKIYYKHWDGYPSNMVPLLALWMTKVMGGAEAKFSVSSEIIPAESLDSWCDYTYMIDLRHGEIDVIGGEE